MNVYFSGISGTGLGPLAELAQDMGLTIFGSDLKRGAISDELDNRGIEVEYGLQDGTFFKKINQERGVNWLVYSSAIPEDHPELKRCFFGRFGRAKRIKNDRRCWHAWQNYNYCNASMGIIAIRNSC